MSIDGDQIRALYAAAEAAHVALGEAQQTYHAAAADRNRAYFDLWAAGVIMQDIADHFGISKGRVGQLVDRHKKTLG